MAFRPFEGCDARVAPPPRSSSRRLLQRVAHRTAASGAARLPVKTDFTPRFPGSSGSSTSKACGGMDDAVHRLVDDGVRSAFNSDRSERPPWRRRVRRRARCDADETGGGLNRSATHGATASTGASPATRASQRTAVELRASPRPRTRARSTSRPARAKPRRADPPRPGVVDEARGRNRWASTAPVDRGSTTMTSLHTSPSRRTGWCSNGTPR
jgi:hypothetical protein